MCTKCNKTNCSCSGEYIDNFLLQKKFGKSMTEGVERARLIPSFMFNYVWPEEHKIPDPESVHHFYRVYQGNWYYWDSRKGKNDVGEYISPVKLQSGMIEGVDGNDVRNPKNLFKKTNSHPALVDESGKQYEVENGKTTLKNKYFLIDNIITDDNKLKAVVDSTVIKKAIGDALAGYKYNVNADSLSYIGVVSQGDTNTKNGIKDLLLAMLGTTPTSAQQTIIDKLVKLL